MKEELKNLAIVEPRPLFPEDAFWDGQPRDDRGRFACGRRLSTAMKQGISATVTVAEAVKMLETPFSIADAAGKAVTFDRRLLAKYRDGGGRPQGRDPKRLMHLGQAVFAVCRASSGTVALPGHNPPQRQYLHKFDSRHAIVVYVEEQTGGCRGFIYSSHRNADRFLENKRGR